MTTDLHPSQFGNTACRSPPIGVADWVGARRSNDRKAQQHNAASCSDRNTSARVQTSSGASSC